MPRLTKRVVDAAPIDPARRTYLWDDALPGFGMQILPSGMRSFVFQYRTAEGRTRRGTLGKFGPLTPDEARRLAETWAAAVRAGGDPLAEKSARRTALTIDDILDAYLASSRFQEKAVSTRTLDDGRIRRHLRPLLGKLPANRITPEHVRRMVATIRNHKTQINARARPRGGKREIGGPSAALDCLMLLKAILNWAVGEGLIAENVAAGVKGGSHGRREVFLEDEEQYRRLFVALGELEAEKRLRPAAADAIRVIAMTGARRGEIAGCRWAYIDLRAGTITLPPSSHKTGSRTGRPRVIMLPAAAQAIIARQPAGKPEDLVFRPTKGANPTGLSAAWRKVRERAELPAAIGLHGLRHSLASHMALNGAQAAEIMEALGHRQLSTAQRYVHFADRARAQLAERAAAPALAGLAAAAPPASPIGAGRDES